MSKSRQKEKDIYTLLRSDDDDNDDLEKKAFHKSRLKTGTITEAATSLCHLGA